MAEPERVIIKGVTNAGRRFRPSDWAQRLATAVSHTGPGRRIVYHPKVRVADVDGVPSVVVERSLADEDPRLYGFLMGFARDNDLETVEE